MHRGHAIQQAPERLRRIVHAVQDQVRRVEIDAHPRPGDLVEEASEFVARFLPGLQGNGHPLGPGVGGDASHGIEHPLVDRIDGILGQKAHVEGHDLHAQPGREVHAPAGITQPRFQWIVGTKPHRGLDGVPITIAFAVKDHHHGAGAYPRLLHQACELPRALRGVEPVRQPAHLDHVQANRPHRRQGCARVVASGAAQENADLVRQARADGDAIEPRRGAHAMGLGRAPPQRRGQQRERQKNGMKLAWHSFLLLRQVERTCNLGPIRLRRGP